MNYSPPPASLDVNVHVTADARMRHVLYADQDRATIHIDAYPCTVTLYVDTDSLARLDRAVGAAREALMDARRSITV